VTVVGNAGRDGQLTVWDSGEGEFEYFDGDEADLRHAEGLTATAARALLVELIHLVRSHRA
jgi:hypothetical protein